MKMRKLFAGVAAMATLLGGIAFGTTTANAADDATATASITVHNAQKDHTYTAYKFATFTKADVVDGTTYLDVTTDEGWNDTLKAAVEAAGLQPGAEYANNYAAYVATLTPAQLRSFVDKLNVTGKTSAAAQAGTEDGADLKLENLAEGWYFVTDSDGKTAVVSSTLAGDAANVKLNTPDGQRDITAVGAFNSKGNNYATTAPTKTSDKDDLKGVGDGTVNVGEKVTYTVEATIPADANAYDTYAYKFTDYPGSGLYVNLGAEEDTSVPPYTYYPANVKVYIADENGNYDETKPVEATVAPETFVSGNDNQSASFTATVANVKGFAGRKIKMVYAATVVATKDGNVYNWASVTPGTRAESEKVQNLLKNYGFSFTKTDADGKALDGAEFTVTNAAGQSIDKNGMVATTVFTGTNGVFSLSGLKAGTYTVEETKAPTGYLSTAKAKFTVTIAKDGTVSYAESEGAALNLGLVTGETSDIKVKNVKSITQLPLTGAAGTALFVVVAALIAGAGVTVFAKSRSTKHALEA
ncbi:cell surface protein fimafimbrial subunit [Bifidobacterium saguini DSM 23967]|uniref:Cell surface protein fimafimbrial subunit n=2 Tax=Bifidobacterium saguini TaxID=762210 RepID=A0A087D8I5_9BIFI|nr:SpaA isopeptide-forming pilin-related protein [Bifidobacterium saguini]KFI91835.1 cell surface protein fimafimbrial subunit [Bifidobacterium saguini DSM 23967]QTB90154.1 isopeptide-forming domain-containing fimbrial protein [Bifidobacterium saguini]